MAGEGGIWNAPPHLCLFPPLADVRAQSAIPWSYIIFEARAPRGSDGWFDGVRRPSSIPCPVLSALELLGCVDLTSPNSEPGRLGFGLVPIFEVLVFLLWRVALNVKSMDDTDLLFVSLMVFFSC